jgi:hypothetical protein
MSRWWGRGECAEIAHRGKGRGVFTRKTLFAAHYFFRLRQRGRQ